MTATTEDRLLGRIRNADSAHPAALDKAAIAAGIGLEAATAAAEALYQQRRINRCERSAGGIVTTLIWPTGAVKPLGAYTGASHSSLFVKTTPAPQALHAAHAPKVQPAPGQRAEKKEEVAMPDKSSESAAPSGNARRSTADIYEILDGLISGRPMSKRVSPREISEALGYRAPGGIKKLMSRFIAKQENIDWVGKFEHGICTYYYDVQAQEDAPATAPSAAAQRARTAEAFAQPPAQAPRSQVDPDPDYSFALWDDGRLSIYDGRNEIEIAPASVKRLARLLGELA